MVSEHISPNAANTQRSTIWLVLNRAGGLTRNEISHKTGLPIQSVCGRIGELLQNARVHRGATRPCKITGRNNETLHATPEHGQTQIEAWT